VLKKIDSSASKKIILRRKGLRAGRLRPAADAIASWVGALSAKVVIYLVICLEFADF
jgi:hypothetical protein